MRVYITTESKQLWQHATSGQVILLDAIAPQDETDESTEYTFSSQGFVMGSESDFISKGWVKLDRSEYVGMPEANPKGRDFTERVLRLNAVAQLVEDDFADQKQLYDSING